MFGAPSEESIKGHPLSTRGLSSHMIAEIENSSWVSDLEQMDSHAPHPWSLKNFRHIIFAFHDDTLECVASDFKTFVCHGLMFKGLLEQMNKWGEANAPTMIESHPG
jgi:hypothetical protein